MKSNSKWFKLILWFYIIFSNRKYFCSRFQKKTFKVRMLEWHFHHAALLMLVTFFLKKIDIFRFFFKNIVSHYFHLDYLKNNKKKITWLCIPIFQNSNFGNTISIIGITRLFNLVFYEIGVKIKILKLTSY